MKIIFSLFNILATALFSLRISHLLAIVLLGIGALLYNVMYIQSIGSGLSSFGDLFNNFFFTKSSIGLEEISLLFFSLVPVVFYLINKLNKKPHEDKLCDGKPSRLLTKAGKEALRVPSNFKEILVGLLLGDLYIEK